MKSIVIHAPKDLRVEEHDASSLGAGQVRIGIAVGGICGSDLHYFNQGGFGTVRIQEPMTLGHEVAGHIEELGSGVTGLAVGQGVAINPSVHCGHCEYCARGLPSHCLDMRFYGSAMRMPHIQGAFSQTLVAQASQCFALTDEVSMNIAALAEPFAVGLHAVNRAGSLAGKRVLVTGCGPIGALAVVAVRHHGALHITATDVLDAPLERVGALGADQVVNVASEPDALLHSNGAKGQFDVMIEASGNEAALRLGLDVLKPRGILVQLGLGGDMQVPQNVIVAKEN